jgi:hypothetical protein
MEEVVSDVLQRSEPVAVVDKVELAQLFTTDTTGADGMVLGAATAVPDALVQPSTVSVTLYVPPAVTVIEEVVSRVFQSSAPVAVVDNVELAQSLITETEGVDGGVWGAAEAVPGRLGQPLTVCVTLYVPAAVTVIAVVVAPVLHNKLPVAVVDNIDAPQLSTAVTSGVAGVYAAVAVPEPAALVQAPIVC